MSRAPVDHRRWPTPHSPWAVAMTWRDLLFMHWPMEADLLQRVVPAPLRVQTFDGRAWLGIVPFVMTGVRGRCLPPLPGTHSFPELNVRTYVEHAGRPGVYFFSLDAASRLAVRAARWVYGLPYFDAAMSCTHEPSADGGEPWRVYESRRIHRGAPGAELSVRYRPTGAAARSAPDTLEHFLTERYCLYTVCGSDRVRCGHIHHAPWSLQPAEAPIERCDMLRLLDLSLPDEPPLLHFAQRLEVVAWLPTAAR